MSHFILMLTNNDVTVDDALAAYDSMRDSPVHYVGFKDIGLPLAELESLAARIRADGRKVMLEVVSTSEAAELQSVQGALEIGVDYLLGGRHVDEALKLLRGSAIRYFPFAGHTAGHPTVLEGSLEQIVDDARRLASLPGVHGLDLLAYRSAEVDPVLLARHVIDAVDVPVIAAGSIDSAARIHAMTDAGAWGFTVGSAIFRRAFAGRAMQAEVGAILQIEGVT